jgi:hypothetical protein
VSDHDAQSGSADAARDAVIDRLEKHVIALSVVCDGLLAAVRELREVRDARPRARVPLMPVPDPAAQPRFHRAPERGDADHDSPITSTPEQER